MFGLFVRVVERGKFFVQQDGGTRRGGRIVGRRWFFVRLWIQECFRGLKIAKLLR